MLNIKSLALSAIALLMLGGCANQNSQMQRDAVMERNKALSVDKVNYVDDMDVLVSDIKLFKENGFLKLMAEFINADNGEKRDFVYQVEWYDQYGQLKETTSWRPKTVIGNQKIKVVEAATIPSIVDYKLIISTKK
ncbi:MULTISPECIES: DUF1425 domain-containing protein [Sulfurospirillum]|jgi:uncharacterized protein YcfL|uniref:DUF1425 domain-containing protein n=1 Tax=Sulfurospirillum cavolei TaxID=366522 RepID=A0A2D3WG40_9BACT|nr:MULTISPECIES: DUF1425 domain-containing protein [Sulfurospirillum]KHG34839.1 MAG: hypothetical protein OA34_01355 [Sulfurospirillum sp. MES]MCD8545457.1 DUF1425 domain-containing protein [Sulfurospirillum cavolei]MCP3652242.1 DUF1425 domain-containing protein [Sulfurospirillum sp. DNRA8]MCR1811092.1 DUF1425 domain-containing protein [Sulfurospirillum sp. DNRA8]DAB36039.1 MAG TPA: DUF1425 domain-containing protein [Sulfurospirillum cavolei]